MDMKIFFLLLISLPVYSQTATSIYDEDTKTPIPYVNIWVVGENWGTIADENGRYLIDKLTLGDSITLSAMGYKNKTVSVLKNADTIYLKPQPILLNEVVIGRKKNKKIKIGTLKNKETLVADFTERGSAEGNFSITRYFSGDVIYEEMPFLTRVTVRAYSKYKNQYFAMAVRSVGENGKPDKLLNDAPILCLVKTGSGSLLKVDVSKLNIKIPANGFFITLEKFQKDAKMVDKSFGPFIVMCKNNNNKDTFVWRYKNGYWLWDYFNNQEIAMEIEIGN